MNDEFLELCRHYNSDNYIVCTPEMLRMMLNDSTEKK